MKKLMMILVLTAAGIRILFAQGCLPEGITFHTQEEIDNFQANYPGCTEIEGCVFIDDFRSGDITNLNGLNVVTYIGGYLIISNTLNLSNLSGLSNLSYIGTAEMSLASLTIESNSALNNLNGLENYYIASCRSFY